MSAFFDSEVVRAEMAEISELQDDVYRSVFKFMSMDNQQKYEHIEKLERLLEKQKILYTRLSLSDDPEAAEMKERITESAKMMGLPQDVDMMVVFNKMTEMIQIMKTQIDSDL
jgi:hypothetical protein